MGVRARAFKAALSRSTNLEHAQAVIVVGPDGDLTLIASDGLDRPLLADALIRLAFAQVDDVHAPEGVPTNL